MNRAATILAEITKLRRAAETYRTQALDLSAEGDRAYSELVDGFIAEMPNWVEDGPGDPYRRANAKLQPTWAEVDRLDGVAAGLEARARELENRLAGGVG